MTTGMAIIAIVMMGFMFFMHKDMMTSHNKHGEQKEESKISPNKTHDGQNEKKDDENLEKHIH